MHLFHSYNVRLTLEFECLYLPATGQVFSFGLNNYGQLGDNTTTSRNVPVEIHVNDTLAITALSCGSYHSLVLTGSNMSVYCCRIIGLFILKLVELYRNWRGIRVWIQLLWAVRRRYKDI
mgnify:CR=1 FL=1